MFDGGRVLTLFQGPLIAEDEDQMDQLIHDYGVNQSGKAPLTLELGSNSSNNTLAPLEELKRYIAFTGETRVTYLRKHLKMRMNNVKELMQTLVNQGWLEAPKTRNEGYKLIISEKERNHIYNKM